MGSYSNCTPTQWDGWYANVTALGARASDPDMALLETVAGELKREGVEFAAN